MTVAMAIILACVAGYVDALAQINDGAFVANMTGNTVFLAIAAVDKGWRPAGTYGLAIAMFLVGALMAQAMRQHLSCRRCALATTAAALLIAAWLHGFAQLVVLAAAMGLQDAACRHFGGISINTVFISGDLVAFSDAVVAAERRSAAAGRKALRLGGVWLGYIGGAAAGALVAHLNAHSVFDPRLALAALVIGAIAAYAPAPRPEADAARVHS